jgi:chaperonin GroES
MEPLFTRLIIKRTVLDKVGSIIIPNKSKEMELSEGIVVAIGSDCERVNVGDYVMFGRYAGCELERNNGTWVMLNEEDLLAKLKEDSNAGASDETRPGLASCET